MSNGVRYYWIDWVKAIAIFLVVLLHLHVTEHIREALLLFVNSLFFISSGYLYKQVCFNSELKKVFQTLFVPCVLYICIIALMYLGIGGKDPVFFRNLAFFNFTQLVAVFAPICPLWFVVALILMRLLSTKKFTPPILTFISVFVFIFCGSKPSNYNYWMVMTTLLCYPFFYMGMILKKFDLVNRWNDYASKHKVVKLLILFVFAILLCRLGLANGHVDMVQCIFGKNLLIFYFVSILISIILILICRSLLDVSSSLIETISNGTLLILALHFPMISFFRRLYSFDSPFSRFMLGVLIMILCYYGIILSKKHLPILLGKYKFLKK